MSLKGFMITFGARRKLHQRGVKRHTVRTLKRLSRRRERRRAANREYRLAEVE